MLAGAAVADTRESYASSQRTWGEPLPVSPTRRRPSATKTDRPRRLLDEFAFRAEGVPLLPGRQRAFCSWTGRHRALKLSREFADLRCRP
jgi:hypothetical protein